MSLTNSPTRYGAVTKTFHWLIALGILVMIPMGFAAVNLPAGTEDEIAAKTWLFSLHKTIGVTIFFVALARILWALTQVKPVALHPDRRAETFAAEVVHWILYGALVLVPLSGWIHHAALDGFAPIWWPFGQTLPFVPKSDAVAAATGVMHAFFNFLLIGSLFLHIAGALKHAVIDRDATLARMLPGRTEAGTPGQDHGAKAPLAAAVVIWVAVASAAVLAPAPERTALASVASDWVVQEGDLTLTITQNGAAVAGEFADWTASISYDPRSGVGEAGDVTVTIAIGSISLGGVTDLAKGADYLSATAFPTATYSGPILRGEDGALVIDGTLTLRDQTIAAPLPFDLQIQDGIAKAQGTLTLDRRDFGVGAGVTDEGQLGFAVDIGVALSATRGE